MKNLTCIILLITLFSNYHLSAQNVDYAAKAKKQKTVGFILLGVGVATAIAGIIVEASDSEDVSGAVEDTFEGAGLVIAGGIVAAASIPFFIAAGKNKQRAVTFYPGIQKIRTPADTGWAYAMQPALKISISIGKR